MPDLVSMLQGNWERGRLRSATVLAVSSDGKVDISWAGATVPNVPCLGWYSPTAGDRVQVLVEPGSLLCLGTLSAGGAGGLGPNLLPNPSFEIGSIGAQPSSWTDFWSTTRGREVQSAGEVHSGGASVLFNATGAPVGNLTTMVTDAVAVDEGATYSVGAWFWANVVDSAHLTCITRIYSAPTPEAAQPFGSGSAQFDLATSSSIGPAWTQVAGVRTIPAGHLYARVMLLVALTSGFTVSKVYADDAFLRRQT